MSERVYEVEWARDSQHLFRSLFSEQPVLSPIPESPLQTPSGEVLTRDRDPSPLPPLIIERVPRHRDHDEPEEFYTKLERKMRKYYKILFDLKQNDDSSSTEFDEEIYGYNPLDISSKEDFNTAFVDDLRLSTNTNRDEESNGENSSSYEDIDDENPHYDSSVTSSRVLASTKIDDDEDGEKNYECSTDQDDRDKEGENSDADSAHSLILSRNVTRRYREERRDSTNADTLKNLRVDENWSVSTFQLAADRIRTPSEETQQDDDEDDDEDGDEDDDEEDDDRAEVREENIIDINNNKTIEEEEVSEENSKDYETMEIEEEDSKHIDLMRHKEITPQRSSIPVALERSFSPITPTFTQHSLDLSKQSTERLSDLQHKHSLAPRTSTPGKRRSRKRAGDDNFDVTPAKMKSIGIQTGRDYLVDVETQTDKVECKNAIVQVSLRK